MPKSAILCVDDERVVLDSLKAQLRAAFGDAYLYEVAENANDALEVIDELREENINILVIVSDWLMPGMKGDEFLIKIHEQFPYILKVLLTGQADQDAIQRAYDQAHLHRCLHKPWNGEELVKIIKDGLATL